MGRPRKHFRGRVPYIYVYDGTSILDRMLEVQQPASGAMVTVRNPAEHVTSAEPTLGSMMGMELMRPDIYDCLCKRERRKGKN